MHNEKTGFLSYLFLQMNSSYKELFNIYNIYITFMHLADAFIQSYLQLHSGYTFSLVCVFPGNEPTTFCAVDAMLYHWATQEHTYIYIYIWILKTTTIPICCYLILFVEHKMIMSKELFKITLKKPTKNHHAFLFVCLYYDRCGQLKLH